MRFLAALPLFCLGITVATAAADEAYIKDEGNRWTLGTATVERVVALEDGKLLLKSVKNKVTGRELGRRRPVRRVLRPSRRRQEPRYRRLRAPGR